MYCDNIIINYVNYSMIFKLEIECGFCDDFYKLHEINCFKFNNFVFKKHLNILYLRNNYKN